MSAQILDKKASRDAYDFDRLLENVLRAIRTELSKNNIDLILKYDKEMVRSSLSKATRLKHLSTVLSLSRMLRKDWGAVTKEDINELLYNVMKTYSPSGQETHSTWDHKKVLKIFFRWFKLGSRDHLEVGDPEETKRIRLKHIKNTLTREQMLTDDDISKLLRSCVNPRDRALLHVHSEAGTRPGEILSLKIKHVKFDQYGAFIYVDGKTGARPIRIVRSVPSLATWIDQHPFKDIPESPLWIILEEPKIGESMTYYTVDQMLRRIAKRAKIAKRVNLKLFRHSEATSSAMFLNEAQMRMRHGWTSSSKMPANYVHLVQADVDRTYLKHLGMVEEEPQQLSLPKICHICKTPNSPESDSCNKCGKPLDLKKAIEMEEKMMEKN
ncbi:MAG: tyrosine-type recombinase/integrase, partial [Rhabdochlamydiaceae bacterium]